MTRHLRGQVTSRKRKDKTRTKKRPRPRKVTFELNRKGTVEISLTVKQQEVVDLAGEPPFKTYAEIARVLTERHPEEPVTEGAVKQRMSRTGMTYHKAKNYCNFWENFRRRRRLIRRGKILIEEGQKR